MSDGDNRYFLAQANIGRIIAPLDDPSMAGFVEQLDFINSVADRSPGFVWRLQTEDGDATAIRAFEDDRILFNMSLWESIDPLYDYVYRSDHLGPVKNRRLWFERMEEAYVVLWWVPAGHLPTVAEAKERLELLRAHGPSPRAFTFRETFSPAGVPIEKSRRDWISQ
jgi:hypothetical protein